MRAASQGFLFYHGEATAEGQSSSRPSVARTTSEIEPPSEAQPLKKNSKTLHKPKKSFKLRARPGAHPHNRKLVIYYAE